MPYIAICSLAQAVHAKLILETSKANLDLRRILGHARMLDQLTAEIENWEYEIDGDHEGLSVEDEQSKNEHVAIIENELPFGHCHNYLESHLDLDPATNTEMDIDTETDADSDADSEADSEADSDSDSETDADSDSDSDSDPIFSDSSDSVESKISQDEDFKYWFTEVSTGDTGLCGGKDTSITHVTAWEVSGL